jgi:hypothetical protein
MQLILIWLRLLLESLVLAGLFTGVDSLADCCGLASIKEYLILAFFGLAFLFPWLYVLCLQGKEGTKYWLECWSVSALTTGVAEMMCNTSQLYLSMTASAVLVLLLIFSLGASSEAPDYATTSD